MYKCKDATIRVKEFKAISIKGVFQASLSYNCDQTIISRYGKTLNGILYPEKYMHSPMFSRSSKY